MVNLSVELKKGKKEKNTTQLIPPHLYTTTFSHTI